MRKWLVRVADEDEVRAALLSARWRFARTMPWYPHWYTLRREDWPDQRQFARVAAAIQRRGVDRHWPKESSRRIFRYYDLVDDDDTEWQFWLMTDRPRQAGIINKARRRRG